MMHWKMILAAVMLVLPPGTAICRGSDADWTDCDNRLDAQAQIHGCTRIISDSAEAPEYRAAAYYQRGNAYGGLGDHERAISDYTGALTLFPRSAWFLASRCWAYSRQGDTSRAIEDCNEAIRLRPTLAQSYTNRGAVREILGNPRQAAADYRMALSVNAEDADDQWGQDGARQALARLQGRQAEK
jgi:tetratricopeptide (TPR) repeat protein